MVTPGSVRRLRRRERKLSSNLFRLELPGAALSPAQGNYPRLVEVPRSEAVRTPSAYKVRMHRKVAKVVSILAVMVGLTIGVRSQESNSRNELWTELDVYVPVNEKVRLFFLFTITKSEETRNNLEGQFGAHVDYTVNKRFVLRVGYRYGFSLTEEDPFKEHLPLVEQTLRQPLPLKILLSDRNREEFRFVNGDFSFRYRNRLRR